MVGIKFSIHSTGGQPGFLGGFGQRGRAILEVAEPGRRG
jgi:hypothetical protein